MSTLLNWLLVAVALGAMFLILIAPHEGGHFLAAKLFKVRVIEFSIGAGPKLFSFVRGGTLYALRLLPILGYVRMGGMEAGDFDQPGGFHSRPPLQRIAILAAGPIANFIVAILLVTGFGLTQLNSDPGKVQRVLAGRPAALVASATTARQRTVRAPLDRIARAAAEEGIEGPALLVVGEVVDALPRRRLEELLTAVGPAASGSPPHAPKPDIEIDRLG